MLTIAKVAAALTPGARKTIEEDKKAPRLYSELSFKQAKDTEYIQAVCRDCVEIRPTYLSL